MLATLVLGMALGAAPVKQDALQWSLQVTMTMSGRSATTYGPATSWERCQAQQADMRANQAAIEKAGGVTIWAGCVPARE